MFGVDWYHEFQVFAARGWAVFFTNPRGSTGKTADFVVANRSRWGEEDYADIMAGVDLALERPWVDRDRLVVLERHKCRNTDSETLCTAVTPASEDLTDPIPVAGMGDGGEALARV